MPGSGEISRRAFIEGIGGGAGAALVGGMAMPAAANAGETDELAQAPTPPKLPVTVLSRGLPPEIVAEIEAVGKENVRLVIASSNEVWNKTLPEADALFGGFSPEDLRVAKKLRWIQYGSAGVEHTLYPELVESQIILTNGKGCYGPAIAEHVIGMLVGLARQVGPQTKQMADGRWGPTGPPREISGMTMGIVGFGGIGRELAYRAKALGLRVLAADIQAMQPHQVGNLAEEIYPVDGGGLEKLLAASDVVVSAAPHTPRSEGMFHAARFAKMKRGAYFINVSRGKLVKTQDLVDALTGRQLAGAALDVTDPEPLPADHPLWKMQNVIITSHIAGQGQSYNRVLAVFAENVRRFAAGLPLLNVVDKRAGF